MKRSCFSFDSNSRLNIFSFFFIFSTVILINRSFLSNSFQFAAESSEEQICTSYLACLLLECFFFSQAPQLVILRLD